MTKAEGTHLIRDEYLRATISSKAHEISSKNRCEYLKYYPEMIFVKAKVGP